jgi:arsenate reductase-like glutaredoxin family protein
VSIVNSLEQGRVGITVRGAMKKGIPRDREKGWFAYVASNVQKLFRVEQTVSPLLKKDRRRTASRKLVKI